MEYQVMGNVLVMEIGNLMLMEIAPFVHQIGMVQHAILVLLVIMVHHAQLVLIVKMGFALMD
jgi:hypothetical protein